MRELIIKFGKEGEYYRELDEERNYLLCEANEIVQKIKIRLDQEKRTVKQKTVELWMNGQKVLVTQMGFDKEQSLEKQLEEALCKTNKEQRKHVKKFKEYAEKERQLFLNREFKTFAIRFDQVLGKPDLVPFPLVLEVDKLKKLFDEVYPHVATGFYSYLEEIITSIDSSYRTIVKQVRQNKTFINDAGLNKEVEFWFEDDEYFSKFVRYAAASFQSVSKKRIDALYPRFRPYQELETFLFEFLGREMGFSDAYELHAELNNAFLKEYDKILFQGTVLKTDEMVKSLVLAPVIQKYWEKLPEIMEFDGKVILDAEQEQVTVSEH
ncbi:hypothetical protein ACFSCZ_12615 [Siminovitchia sediminis]|uniref:Sporulation protein YtxC n=1 Tax=Siminovitchia sediminis TaxID=1274353 RepID=A0ABW4KHE4_9BACI